MANKRMFSKQITASDAFVDMPVSTQLLYFHLNMEADDDGFVSNPKRVMRMLNVGDDDIKILLAKRFILAFESGVVVIKHWLLHNAVRKDMYKRTQYIEEKKGLKIKDNGVYTEVRNEVVTPLLHRLDQDRSDKIKIEDHVAESSATFSLKDEIEKLEANPRREMQIIGYYFSERKPDIRNKPQYQVAIKRHLRAAKMLIPFDDDQLVTGFNKAKNQTPEWVLETVAKMLTK